MAKQKKEIIYCDDAETYLMIGYDDIDKAARALHRYEKKECGLDKEEFFPKDAIEKVKIRLAKKDGEDWYYWGEDHHSCKECKRPYDDLIDGFIGSI